LSLAIKTQRSFVAIVEVNVGHFLLFCAQDSTHRPKSLGARPTLRDPHIVFWVAPGVHCPGRFRLGIDVISPTCIATAFVGYIMPTCMGIRPKRTG